MMGRRVETHACAAFFPGYQGGSSGQREITAVRGVGHNARRRERGLATRLAKDAVPAANGGTAKKEVLRYRVKEATHTKASHRDGSDGGVDVGRLKQLTWKVATTVGYLKLRHRGRVGDVVRKVDGVQLVTSVWTQYASRNYPKRN